MKYLICALLAGTGWPVVLNAQTTDTLRFMHYNVLKYGYEWACMAQSVKNSGLKTIFNAYQPDILTVNEMESKTATIELLRTATLTYNTAMRATPFSNTNASDIVNGLYYNSLKFGYLGSRAIRGNVRDIDAHRLYYKPATVKNDTFDIWYLVAHLKAGSEYRADRAEAAKDVANWLTANRSTVQRYIIAGDFNLYSSEEETWQIFTAGTSPRFIDPAGQLTGWEGQQYARHHTQSPNDRSSNDCAVTGGMDNRFDFILVSPTLNSGIRNVRVVDYQVFGNDGVSYNEYLDCNDTKSVSSTICSALRRVSDHLPVTMRMALPNTTSPGDVFEDVPFRAEIWGNPAAQAFNVQLNAEKSGRYSWEIIDVLGRKLAEGSEALKSGDNLFAVDVPESLTNSTYFLIVRNAEDKALMLRFAVLR
jgi:endonuclease/exonuclease/phosphatase family metal-dependent hydrolase